MKPAHIHHWLLGESVAGVTPACCRDCPARREFLQQSAQAHFARAIGKRKTAIKMELE